MEIVTVHYNTPLFVEGLVRSVRKFTDCTVHVFDNSDEEPFTKRMDGVEVIDNTCGQIVDFQSELEMHPDRIPGLSNHGSAKHCMSVDACFGLFPDGFILMDSDILVKRDFTWIWDESVAWSGEVADDNGKGVMRVLPYICYINVPMCREHGVRYFNGGWMWNLSKEEPNRWYDTGSWFLKDCTGKGLPHTSFYVGDYAEHYGHGSHEFFNIDYYDWLMEHKELWA